MRLRADGDRNTAYLSLDDTGAVANRLVFTSEDHRNAWGIDLDFDANGHLVGVEFENAHRQVPERLLRDGDGLRAEYDGGLAYLYLTEIPKGGVEHTLRFGDEETRAAWGINLDFARAGRLLGIEFESGDLAPSALLEAAHRLPPPPPPKRSRVVVWRIRDAVGDVVALGRHGLRRLRPRKSSSSEDSGR